MKIQTRQKKTYKSADLRGYFFSVRVVKFKFFFTQNLLKTFKTFLKHRAF